jgi:hypothetical protein
MTGAVLPAMAVLAVAGLALAQASFRADVRTPGDGERVERLRGASRSRAHLQRGDRQLEVLLFAHSENVETVGDPYCGGAKGAREYSGHYQLASVHDNRVLSQVSLRGLRRFTEGQRHDGLRLLRVPETREPLLGLYQYRSCDYHRAEFFRVDDDGRLHPVPFVNRDGSEAPDISIGGDVRRRGSRLGFCHYDGGLAHYLCDAYTYDGRRFLQAASWMSRASSARTPPPEAGSPLAEARRALFEYLSALHQAKYGQAAHYFAGSYEVLRRYNAAPGAEDRVRLLETYCAPTCWKPERIAEQRGQGAEMRFAVSFLTGEGQTAVLDGRSAFEFRVRRVGGEFKVLDLPPHPP